MTEVKSSSIKPRDDNAGAPGNIETKNHEGVIFIKTLIFLLKVEIIN